MRRHPRPPMGPPGLMGPPMHGMGMRPPRPPMGPRPPIPGMELGMGPPMPGMVPPHAPVPSAIGPISSVTNCSDATSKNSRLFVGNLNTIALNKEAIEAIFSRYGAVIAISMHKGYAFVQYAHPDEARRAGANEDGKHYAGQAIDINIVSQPKNRNALKRTAGRTGNDAPPSLMSLQSHSPAKKLRSDLGPNPSLMRTLVTLSGSNESNKRTAANNAVRKAIATVAKKNTAKQLLLKGKGNNLAEEDFFSDSDILICGNCKLQFTGLHSLTMHKKVPCQLRISSQAKDDSNIADESGEPACLMCNVCEAEFSSAWSLCLHCSEEHKIVIFKTTEPSATNGGDTEEQKEKKENEVKDEAAGDAQA